MAVVRILGIDIEHIYTFCTKYFYLIIITKMATD